MSQRTEDTMQALRSFMFEHVYKNPVAKGEESKAVSMLQELYNYYTLHTDEMPDEYRYLIHEKQEKQERVVCDYIAGMTDQYAIDKFTELFVPKAWGALQ
jgi:dGTPase